MKTNNEIINFKDIDVKNKTTWSGKKIISIDIDWATDDVLLETIELLERLKVKATFFVTHHTCLLRRIKDNEFFEIGIHPNFNELFNLHSNNNSAKDIVNSLLKIVPDCYLSRSHSLTTSSFLHNIYRDCGIKILSNYSMFASDEIKPFEHLDGILEVPIYLHDDALLYRKSNGFESFDFFSQLNKKSKGIKVFGFHPIHLFLNTKDLKHYKESKPFLKNINKLQTMKSDLIGPKDWLKALI